MKQTAGFFPRLKVDTSGRAAVGQAGGVMLTETVRASGLDVALRTELARWRHPTARHDPAKVVLDLAMILALGGDTCSGMAVVCAGPAVFGKVALDPMRSRTTVAVPRRWSSTWTPRWAPLIARRTTPARRSSVSGHAKLGVFWLFTMDLVDLLV